MSAITSDVVLTRLEDEESCVQVIPFGVSSLPKKMMSTQDAFDSMSLTANDTVERGVVGTVMLLGKSAMIWVGWGSLEESNSSPVTPAPLGKGRVSTSLHNGCPVYYYYFSVLVFCILCSYFLLKLVCTVYITYRYATDGIACSVHASDSICGIVRR
jgi:hypothetical protein